MARLILTVPGEDAPIGSDSDVFGTETGGEVITVVDGNIRFDPSFNIGGDTIDLPGNASTFTVVRVGSNVTISSGAATVLIPVGNAGLDVRFDDTTLVLRVSGGNVVLGNQVVTTTAAPVNPNTPPAAQLPSMAEIAGGGEELAGAAIDPAGHDMAAMAARFPAADGPSIEVDRMAVHSNFIF